MRSRIASLHALPTTVVLYIILMATLAIFTPRPASAHPASTVPVPRPPPATTTTTTTTTTTPPPTTATVPPPPPDPVTPTQHAAWERVAVCEEGGNWQADGPRFSGGLGITRANWVAYGGQAFAQSGAQATPDQQIQVAQRIQSSPPDQNGCTSW